MSWARKTKTSKRLAAFRRKRKPSRWGKEHVLEELLYDQHKSVYVGVILATPDIMHIAHYITQLYAQIEHARSASFLYLPTSKTIVSNCSSMVGPS